MGVTWSHPFVCGRSVGGKGLHLYLRWRSQFGGGEQLWHFRNGLWKQGGFCVLVVAAGVAGAESQSKAWREACSQAAMKRFPGAGLVSPLFPENLFSVAPPFSSLGLILGVGVGSWGSVSGGSVVGSNPARLYCHAAPSGR